MNITLIGFMGTGKSVVGRQLAKRLGWRFVNVDDLIEATAKKPIAQLFTEHGEAVFRRLEKRAIRRAIRGDQLVIATGGGAFVNPENRRLLRGVGPVICLCASPKVILQRVRPTLSKRPMLAHVTSPLDRIEQLLVQRAASYAKADLTIDTSRLGIEEVVDQIWETVSAWVSKSWRYLMAHHDKLTQRYGGKYIAVLDDRVVAVGTTHLNAYQQIRKPVPAGCEVAIYYIPLPEESAVALSCESAPPHSAPRSAV